MDFHRLHLVSTVVMPRLQQDRRPVQPQSTSSRWPWLYAPGQGDCAAWPCPWRCLSAAAATVGPLGERHRSILAYAIISDVVPRRNSAHGHHGRRLLPTSPTCWARCSAAGSLECRAGSGSSGSVPLAGLAWRPSARSSPDAPPRRNAPSSTTRARRCLNCPSLAHAGQRLGRRLYAWDSWKIIGLFGPVRRLGRGLRAGGAPGHRTGHAALALPHTASCSAPCEPHHRRSVRGHGFTCPPASKSSTR